MHQSLSTSAANVSRPEDVVICDYIRGSLLQDGKERGPCSRLREMRQEPLAMMIERSASTCAGTTSHADWTRYGAVVALMLLVSGLPTGGQPAGATGPLLQQQRVIKYTENGLVEVEITEHLRPTFYTGPMPLKYLSGKRDFGSPSSSRMTVWSDFGNFRVEYTPFSQRRAVGFGVSFPGNARVLDKRGRLLAEGRGIAFHKAVGLELEETHYSSDMVPVFRCRSFIDFDGRKVQEIVLKGRKTSEYFFIWPTGH